MQLHTVLSILQQQPLTSVELMSLVDAREQGYTVIEVGTRLTTRSLPILQNCNVCRNFTDLEPHHTNALRKQGKIAAVLTDIGAELLEAVTRKEPVCRQHLQTEYVRIEYVPSTQ